MPGRGIPAQRQTTHPQSQPSFPPTSLPSDLSPAHNTRSHTGQAQPGTPGQAKCRFEDVGSSAPPKVKKPKNNNKVCLVPSFTLKIDHCEVPSLPTIPRTNTCLQLHIRHIRHSLIPRLARLMTTTLSITNISTLPLVTVFPPSSRTFSNLSNLPLATRATIYP